MTTAANHKCAAKMINTENWSRFPCPAPGVVEREGEWYCETHDPDRIRELHLASIEELTNKVHNERDNYFAALVQIAKERDKYLAALLQIAKEDMERFTRTSSALGLLYGPFAEIALEVLPEDKAKEVHAHHKVAFERWKAEEEAE